MEKRLDNDEADLNMLFNSIRKGRDNFSAFLYDLFLIIKKRWVVLSLLIIAGIACGFYMEHYGNKQYTTSLVIQTNQKSTEIIYDYIENINSYSLESKGFAPNEILDLEIVAVPNFKDLLDSYESQNINLIEFLLENASADDVLRAEFFRDSYRFHKIEVELGNTSGEESIDKFIALLNDVDNYKEINAFYGEFNTRKVVEFEKMLTQIDETIEQYNSKSPGDDTNLAVTGVNYRENNFVTSLVEYKTYVMRFLENAKYDAVTAENNVYLVNEPIIKHKKPFLPLMIAYPLAVFIFFFLGVYFLRFLHKGKEVYESKQA
ncbi:MAG: hypothetical protein ACJA1H_002712 [Glaciecola sp.]|jgi:hypothetical protein|uniref:hypothetical protein n=1 Tax=Patiriisocius sp. Uisw_047 TaxID=3230969 RepID=UPI0039E923F7